MRSFLVGIVLLLISGSVAHGQQVSGFVEKIGFGKVYRPYGWTPVLVSLTAKSAKAEEYTIQVRQEDLDRDRVIFSRDITLNANDGTKTERFWVYFMAQPRGLGEGTPQELMQLLDIRLCTRSGKPLVKLGIQDPALNVEPRGSGFSAVRGNKLVLVVIDGSGSRSSPRFSEYQGAIGLNEDVVSVLVTPFDLPENVIGYDAVDAIVWLDADAANMTSGGSRRLAAMTEWVRGGGRLVVSQPNELFKVEPMADLLPVQTKNDADDWVIQWRDRKSLWPISELSEFNTPDASQLLQEQQLIWQDIERKSAPFKVAHAKLRDDARGEFWIDWNGDRSDMSPWLARRAVGLGTVTWVAQDLGNPAITARKEMGWPNVWDRILGMRNTGLRTLAETDRPREYAERAKQTYSTSSSVDVGASMLRGMEHEGRAGGLVFLAGVFFVGYWVVAGPVSYLVLAGKKRTELSWTIFAVSALVATLLTVGVVRLVLRGDAEVHHVSLVRMLPAGRGEDGSPVSRAIVSSRIGLYIPRDGAQTITLRDNDPAGLSYITPFSVHPAHLGSTTEFPAYLEYSIPVRDNPLNEPVTVEVPFRSTLKKLQARWVGTIPGGIEPVGGDAMRPKIVPGDHKIDMQDANGKMVKRDARYINGALTNRSGSDLVNVYFVFSVRPFDGAPEPIEEVLYVPSWANGASINLTDEYYNARMLQPRGTTINGRATPGNNNKFAIKGQVNEWASNYWLPGLGSRAGSISDHFDDSRGEFLRSFPILSLYDRITPLENEPPGNISRHEVLRRAARDWDVSDLVQAGQLVVLAQAGKPGSIGQSPLPFPLEVEGDRVAGTGPTFYQFDLTPDRSMEPKPWQDPEPGDATTQPVEAARAQ